MPSHAPTDESAPGRAAWLDRTTAGLPRWLGVALLATLAIAFIPAGARRALESNANRAQDWLVAGRDDAAELRWFREHFRGAGFVVVSWDGCTLDGSASLLDLQRRLEAIRDDAGRRWYPEVVSGPSAIAALGGEPAELDRSAAIARLEGALVGPRLAGATDDGGRVSCLVARLAEPLLTNNRAMRDAIERIRQVAHADCGVPLETIHLGGPPVDNVAIDAEAERTLLKLAGLSALVGLAAAYVCFRSWKLTGMVLATAVTGAGLSLAAVAYWGAIEVLGFGLAEPRFGRTDAVLMSMPAVVFVLTLSAAIHLINYYLDARRERGATGAVERALRAGAKPCVLAAATTAIGLAALAASDIVPIRKFGAFAAVGLIASVALLFAMLAVLLHRFPPRTLPGVSTRRHRWTEWFGRVVTVKPSATGAVCVGVIALLAAGLPATRTSVRLLDLLPPEHDLVADYGWLERNLGALAPVEVVVSLAPQQLRESDQPAEHAGGYRMTLAERADLVAALHREIERLEPVGCVLAATTFGPEGLEPGETVALAPEAHHAIGAAIEQSRAELRPYWREERGTDGLPTGRELWRLSVRLPALGDFDHAAFLDTLRRGAEPVLDAYRARDAVVALLHERGVSLAEARIAIVSPEGTHGSEAATAARLRRLLASSTGDASRIATRRVGEPIDAAACDVVVALSAEAAGAGATLVSVGGANDAAPEIAAVYTGVVPLVHRAQGALLTDLSTSLGWAVALIALVMMAVLRSPVAGVLTMLPNLAPLVAVFGALGLLGVAVNIGTMMTASVALGVAVDDTVHFLAWFRRGVDRGLDRRTATREAIARCATAMIQTTLVAGLGLAVFASSGFVPTQQFGLLMVSLLGAALVGDLVLLPAMLCGPLGRVFAPYVAAKPYEKPAAPVVAEAPKQEAAARAEPPAPVRPVAAKRVDAPQSAATAALRRKLRSLRRTSRNGSPSRRV